MSKKRGEKFINKVFFLFNDTFQEEENKIFLNVIKSELLIYLNLDTHCKEENIKGKICLKILPNNF